MQAHDYCNTMPAVMVSRQDPRRITRNPCFGVLVDSDESMPCATKACEGTLCGANNNDESVNCFESSDDLSCSSEDSTIDERDLLELWHSEEDYRDDDYDNDDSSSSSDLLIETTLCYNGQKQVTFGSVTVREYGLAVGAYSAARDSCPLQLTWAYAPPTVYTVDYYTYFRDFGRNRTLQRLSLNKRRKRIAKVQGVPFENILLQECELTFATIQDSIRNVRIDHPNLISDGLFNLKSLLRAMPPLPLT